MTPASISLNLNFYWAISALILAVDAVWIVAGNWSVPLPSLLGRIFFIAALASPLFINRYRQDERISHTVRFATLLIVFSSAASALSYLVTSVNLPLFDDVLSSWDNKLGFDWNTAHSWMRNHEFLKTLLHYVYVSFLPQSLFVTLFLGFTFRLPQLGKFMESIIISCLLTIIISGLLPAAGPSLGLWFPDFEMLRNGSLRTIDLYNTQGLISFPSYHTVLAILLTYAMRNTPLFSVFFILNSAMIFSTPTEGGHYLVDVAGGAAIALFAIVWVERSI
jgi:membrane-associated phospholipid phosphatase